MRIYMECIPCILNQGIRTIRKVTSNSEKQWEIIRKMIYAVNNVNINISPFELAIIINNIIKESVGNNDPYLKDKNDHNNKILDIYSEIEEKVNKAKDRLMESIKYSICGNRIDLGIFPTIDISKVLEMCNNIVLEEKYLDLFKKELNKSNNILFIADNAGEIVFDKILINILKEMGKSVYLGVRKFPIINDITAEDAIGLGFNNDDIIPIGLEDIEIADSYDLVISKGQANFELYHKRNNVIFLFIVKCAIIAKVLNVPMYSIYFNKFGDDL